MQGQQVHLVLSLRVQLRLNVGLEGPPLVVDLAQQTLLIVGRGLVVFSPSCQGLKSVLPAMSDVLTQLKPRPTKYINQLPVNL